MTHAGSGEADGPLAVRLTSIDPDGARRIREGGCPPGLRPAPDFPDEDDRIAAGMFLERLAVAPDPRPFGIFAISLDEPAGLPVAVGGIGFHGPPDEAGDVEIGYAVVPSCRRRGIARAALALGIAYARDHGAARLLAEVDPDNVVSLRVVDGAGFRRVAPASPAPAGSDARLRFALVLHRGTPPVTRSSRPAARIHSDGGFRP